MREISITEFDGLRIGQAENETAGTGCTVLLLGENGAPAGLDVRGGGPASRESELLKPMAAAGVIHAILLSGGSAFGLDAAGVCIEDALHALADLTGEDATEAVIDQVFETFCVGK